MFKPDTAMFEPLQQQLHLEKLFNFVEKNKFLIFYLLFSLSKYK